MNSQQEAKLNMYRSIKQLCDDNATTIATNTAFLGAFNTYKAKLSTLITTATSESQIITGIAVDKTVAKKNLCQLATDISAIVFAYASSVNNNTLKNGVSLPFSDLFKLKDDQLPLTCQNIHGLATTNATALVPFGITAAMLTTLQTSITDYSTAVPKPKTAKSVKSTYTKNIKLLIKEIDTILKDQMDKLVVAFKPTKPDFVTSFKNARVIIDPAKTTTQLKGKVVDFGTKLPVKGAIVQIAGITSSSITTTKAGIYTQKPTMPGTYTITVTAEGYQQEVLTGVVVKTGQINKQDVKLTEI